MLLLDWTIFLYLDGYFISLYANDSVENAREPLGGSNGLPSTPFRDTGFKPPSQRIWLTRGRYSLGQGKLTMTTKQSVRHWRLNLKLSYKS